MGILHQSECTNAQNNKKNAHNMAQFLHNQEHSQLKTGPRVNKPTTDFSHFSCLGRTRQGKRSDCATSQFLSPPPQGDARGLAPTRRRQATALQRGAPSPEMAHSVNGQESPLNPGLTSQSPASAQPAEASCSSSAASVEKRLLAMLP